MLSSSWHVTLRLTIFEIFAVKWTKLRPKISDFNRSWGTSPKREEDVTGTVPLCKISRAVIGATVTEISVTGQRQTATNIAFRTNVWRLTSASAKRIPAIRGGQLKLCAAPHPLFKGNKALNLTILKNSQNVKYLALWGTPPGATAQRRTFLDSSFDGQHFCSR